MDTALESKSTTAARCAGPSWLSLIAPPRRAQDRQAKSRPPHQPETGQKRRDKAGGGQAAEQEPEAQHDLAPGDRRDGPWSGRLLSGKGRGDWRPGREWERS